MADLHKFGINHVSRLPLFLMSIPLSSRAFYNNPPQHATAIIIKHRKKEGWVIFLERISFLPMRDARASVKNAPSAQRSALVYKCFYLWALIWLVLHLKSQFFTERAIWQAPFVLTTFTYRAAHRVLVVQINVSFSAFWKHNRWLFSRCYVLNNAMRWILPYFFDPLLITAYIDIHVCYII